METINCIICNNDKFVDYISFQKSNSDDIFQLNTFIIRFIGGFVLGVIYFYRGFGISVMTHISYDFILVSLPLIYNT